MREKSSHFTTRLGTKVWKVDGKYHRNRGPAVIDCWTTNWYIRGKQHRCDGPAVIWENGTKEWWINGQRLNTADIDQWMADRGVTWPFDKDTQVEFLLTWA